MTPEIITLIIGILTFGALALRGFLSNENRITKVETKIEVFWRDVSFDAAKILHTPHTENSRRDFLIVRWEKREIGLAELQELIAILEEIVPEENREMAERQAASLLLRALEAEYNQASKPMANITPNK
jgi:hypothetical protein